VGEYYYYYYYYCYCYSYYCCHTHTHTHTNTKLSNSLSVCLSLSHTQTHTHICTHTQQTLLQIIAYFWPFLYITGPSLVFMVLYVWSRKQPHEGVVFFGFQIQRWHFPFILLVCVCVHIHSERTLCIASFFPSSTPVHTYMFHSTLTHSLTHTHTHTHTHRYSPS